jgi:hypothetical protein
MLVDVFLAERFETFPTASQECCFLTSLEVTMWLNWSTEGLVTVKSEVLPKVSRQVRPAKQTNR